jgi:hypothetical protein
MRLIRLGRKDAERRRRENEERLERLFDSLRTYGLEPVLLGTPEPLDIYGKFLAWADARAHGMAGAW